MKKLFAILVAMLALAFVACSSDAEDTEPEVTTPAVVPDVAKPSDKYLMITNLDADKAVVSRWPAVPQNWIALNEDGTMHGGALFYVEDLLEFPVDENNDRYVFEQEPIYYLDGNAYIKTEVGHLYYITALLFFDAVDKPVENPGADYILYGTGCRQIITATGNDTANFFFYDDRMGVTVNGVALTVFYEAVEARGVEVENTDSGQLAAMRRFYVEKGGKNCVASYLYNIADPEGILGVVPADMNEISTPVVEETE